MGVSTMKEFLVVVPPTPVMNDGRVCGDGGGRVETGIPR